MKDDVITEGVSSISTVGIVGGIVESDKKLQFDALVEQLSSPDKEKGDIHHDDRCGDEEECNNEGGIFTTNFVCYCNYDQRQQEAYQKVQELLRQASDFADTHEIYNREALRIHERIGNINRQYNAAKSLGLVQLQLELLKELKRFEDGVELALQHNNHTYALDFLIQLNDHPRLLRYAQEKNLNGVAVETLLKMKDIDGALKYAEDKAMHEKSLAILCSEQRTDEAISYAEKYNLHDKAVKILADQSRYQDLFEYGEKHGCQSKVKKKSEKILENLLNENNASRMPSKARELCAIMEHARELCIVMEHHQLQRSASLYREVIEEFERRVKAKRHISEYEELLEREFNKMRWFDVDDLEISLGNLDRYKKIWKKTKEIWENRPREPEGIDKVIDGSMMDLSGYATQRIKDVYLAQSMIDNPRYHSQHEGLPRLGISTWELLRIAMPLAELSDLENEAGEKKYPVISLENVLAAWGRESINTFFKPDYGQDYRNKMYGYSKNYDTYVNRSAIKFMVEELPSSLGSVHSAEAFTFIVYHFPHLFQTNEAVMKSMEESARRETFFRLGKLLEYALAETAHDETGARRKLALENLLYVPVNQLTQENIFAIATGGPDAVWKHIVSNEKKTEKQTDGSFIDQRLRDIQQEYPHFDEATKKRMKQVFFEAYTSSEMTKALDKALTLYVELKQAYGMPMIFPAKHPLYFLCVLPSDEAEKQDYVKQLMEEVSSVPKKRKQIVEIALERTLHDFFEVAFSIDSLVRRPELVERLTEFLTASPQQLDVYLLALKNAKEMAIPFFELDATPKGEHESLPKWAFLEHYSHFSSAILTESSSLFVPGILSKYTVTTARPQGKKQGIRERMLREVDAIGYLFREMHQIAQSQTFKEKASFRQAAVSSIVELWKEKQEKFLPPEVAETLAKFNFNRFFHEKEEPIQRYLETAKKKQISADSLFVDQPDILFTRILDSKYYLGIKHGLDDDL